jgi:hypothetical protein
MSEVLINGLDINEGTNYRVRSISHDNSPPMRMSTLEIARRDGEELVASSFGPKRIEIEGTVKASNNNELVEKIDDLKKYCLKDDLIDLDIPYGANTRRYEVQVSNVFIGNEHFNVNFSPFTIVCEAIEEPMGRGTDFEEALSVNSYSLEYETCSPTFDGSAPPKPVIRYTVNTAGNLEGIQIRNRNTDTRLETFTGYSDNDELTIDTDKQEVRLNDEPFSFEGIFPKFEIDTNNLESVFLATDSIAISQEKKNAIPFSIWKNRKIAQNIRPDSNMDVPRIEIYANHVVNKPNFSTGDSITLRVETNSGGEPSGTLVDVNATATLQPSEINPNKFHWFVFDFDADISLTSGTDYWIVLNEDWTGYTASKYRIGLAATDEYTGGLTADTLYTGGVLPFSNTIRNDKRGIRDVTFRVWESQGATVNWDVGMNIDYYKRYY